MTDAASPPPESRPRPAPIPDAESAQFWSATLDGRLLIQRCASCGHAQLYARPHCLRCRGPVVWETATGHGTVYSYTVIRQNPSRSFRHLLPLVVALIDLDEGPRLMSNVVGCSPEQVRVGAVVTVRWEPLSDAAALPVFELAP